MNTTKKTVRVHNLLLLDDSGSMESIYSAALSGANESIKAIRKAQEKYPEQEHLFSFVTFSTELDCFESRASIKTVFDDVPIGDIHDLTNDDYHPSACTPLYDAMGFALNKLKKKVSDGDRVLVTVITDGLENASQEYSGVAIKKLVERLKNKGWTFVYIGANQDAAEVAGKLSIRNSLNFNADPLGTSLMFGRAHLGMDCFYSRIDPAQKAFSDEHFFDE